MNYKKKNIIAICGPNASGKTSLAVDLALKYWGEIISVDSRQVYRNMDIGTGKDLAEYSRATGNIPYHLIDIADPEDVYTLHHFQQDFYKIFREITQRKRIPFASGGTGLYLEAVLKHYEIPNVPENKSLRKKLAKLSRIDLVDKLKISSPELYSKTDVNSKKRIIRSLEIVSYSKKNEYSKGAIDPPDFNAVVLCIKWDRETLRKRIDIRLEKRLKTGMIEEVEKLLKSGISMERFNMFGLEYKFIAYYVQGSMKQSDMISALRHAIHRYAKRQETYFRGMERRGTRIHWVNRASRSEAVDVLSKYGFAI